MDATTLVILGVIAVIALAMIAIYNSLVRKRNQVENAWRQIDVQLRRRHDLIPNLVEVVKDYMSYEQDTLRQVVEARQKAVAAQGGPRADAIEAEAQLGATLGRLFALFENYPDLKANQAVADLTEQLTTTENRIAFARQNYNDSVMTLNNQVETFPANLIAGTFGFDRERYFEVPDEAREPVAVDLR